MHFLAACHIITSHISGTIIKDTFVLLVLGAALLTAGCAKVTSVDYYGLNRSATHVLMGSAACPDQPSAPDGVAAGLSYTHVEMTSAGETISVGRRASAGGRFRVGVRSDIGLEYGLTGKYSAGRLDARFLLVRSPLRLGLDIGCGAAGGRGTRHTRSTTPC